MNKNIAVFIKNKKWLFRMADRIEKYAVRYMPKAIYERIEVDVNFPCTYGMPAEAISQDLQWELRPWVHDFVKKNTRPFPSQWEGQIWSRRSYHYMVLGRRRNSLRMAVLCLQPSFVLGRLTNKFIFPKT